MGSITLKQVSKSFGNDEIERAGLFDAMMITVFTVISLPIAALVLSSAALGEERRQRTMPFLVLKPVNRWVLAAAATVAAMIAIIVVGGIGVVATWLIGAVVASKPLIGLPPLVSVLVASAGYAAIFVPLGLLISRSTLTGLAYIFIWETIIGSIASGVSASSMWRTGLSAYGDVGTLHIRGFQTLDDPLAYEVPPHRKHRVQFARLGFNFPPGLVQAEHGAQET